MYYEQFNLEKINFEDSNIQNITDIHNYAVECGDNILSSNIFLNYVDKMDEFKIKENIYLILNYQHLKIIIMS